MSGAGKGFLNTLAHAYNEIIRIFLEFWTHPIFSSIQFGKILNEKTQDFIQPAEFKRIQNTICGYNHPSPISDHLRVLEEKVDKLKKCKIELLIQSKYAH